MLNISLLLSDPLNKTYLFLAPSIKMTLFSCSLAPQYQLHTSCSSEPVTWLWLTNLVAEWKDNFRQVSYCIHISPYFILINFICEQYLSHLYADIVVWHFTKSSTAIWWDSRIICINWIFLVFVSFPHLISSSSEGRTAWSGGYNRFYP